MGVFFKKNGGGLPCPPLPEELIEGMLVLVIPVFQINAERVVPLVGDLVNVFIAHPEFTIQIAKPIFVFIPRSVKVDRTILTPLDDCPASTCQGLSQCVAFLTCHHPKCLGQEHH